MTAEEFKKANPEAYAQVVAEAKASGVQEERSRADALLKMGEVAGCPEVAASFIRDGSAVAEDKVQTTFFEKRVAKANLDAQAKDETTIPAAALSPHQVKISPLPRCLKTMQSAWTTARQP